MKEIVVPVYVQTETAAAPKPTAEKKPLFAEMSDDELLGYGVPAEWLNDVKKATEDTLLALADHLPAEAAEALLELATGGKPRVPQPAAAVGESLRSSRRPAPLPRDGECRGIAARARFPWEKWTVFLHPEQREWVERDYTGPARVSGSAGTGKTIVALHRAAHLARTHPDARVLLTTFSDTLANALHTKLKRLLSNEPRLAERIDVHSLNAIGLRLYKAHVGPATIASREVDTRADARGRDCRRRPQVQPAFSAHRMGAGGRCVAVGELGGVSRCRAARPKDPAAGGAAQGAVVDLRARSCRAESAQADHPRGAVHLAGGRDLRRARTWSSTSRSWTRRRTSASPISGSSPPWAAVGPTRCSSPATSASASSSSPSPGRPSAWTSRALAHPARQLPHLPSDPHAGGPAARPGGDRRGRQQRGPERYGLGVQRPAADDSRRSRAKSEEIKAVGNWIAEQAKAGVLPHEFGVFVRSAAQLDRARAAAKEAGMPFKILDEHVETTSGHVSISTMHLAKGLEFRAVAVMACDDEIIPLQERIETVGDDADLQEVYDTERHLSLCCLHPRKGSSAGHER